MKNFEVCPKRHYEIDLAKNYKEPEGEQLRWGNFVHDALAKRCKDGTPLPKDLLSAMPYAEAWAAKVLGTGGERRVRADWTNPPAGSGGAISDGSSSRSSRLRSISSRGARATKAVMPKAVARQISRSTTSAAS